jgi:hypothetical protein
MHAAQSWRLTRLARERRPGWFSCQGGWLMCHLGRTLIRIGQQLQAYGTPRAAFTAEG